MRKYFKILIVYVVCVALCLGLFFNVGVERASAAETMVSVNLSGTYDYEQAYQILELVNEERAAAGLSPLTMDKDLLDAAMLRAAETNIYFSHTRPNGEDCDTVCSKLLGENISVNYSASGAMSGWMNSEGHKENILNSSYKSIGVGVFYQDGYTFYVQCFGTSAATNVTKPTNKTTSVAVSVSATNMAGAEISFDKTSYKVTKSSTAKAKVMLTNLGWEYASCELSTDDVTFSSADTSVATIDSDGLITGQYDGDTIITAKLKIYPYTSLTASVNSSGFNVPVTSISVKPVSASLTLGVTETVDLTATLSPADATNKKVTWTSSDTSVATVSSTGKVTAVGMGKTTITVTSESGSKTDTCEVTVYKTQDRPSAPTLKSKGTTTVTLTPVDGCQYSKDGTIWQTNNVFNDLNAGTTYTFYIRKKASGYYLASEKSAGLTVTTYNQVSEVTVSPETAILTMGVADSITLSAIVSPEGETDPLVTWYSSQKYIADVGETSGVVTAVHPGQAVITAVSTSDSAKKASCTIEVYGPHVKPTKPTLYSATKTSVKLYQRTGYEYSMDGVTWQESNEFTGLNPNTTYSFYTRRLAEGYYLTSEKSDPLTVTTYSDVTAIEVTPSSAVLTIGVNDSVKLSVAVLPDNAYNKNYTYSLSGYSNIVDIDKSTLTVTALKPGKSVFKAMAWDGDAYGECVIEIYGKHETPAAPELEKRTDTSITLKAVEYGEYSMDGVSWQDSNVFTGLTAQTEYTFYVRLKAEGYFFTSDISEAGTIETLPETIEEEIVVTSVDITSDTKEFTISSSTATVSTTLNVRVLPYEAYDRSLTWTSSDTNVATVDSKGKVTAVGMGEATITAENISGKSDTCKVTVYYRYDMPKSLKLESKTSTSVTLKYMEGCEYSLGGNEWQDSNVFTGLNPNTRYTFYVRMKAHDYYVESQKSTGLSVVTLEADSGGATEDNSGNDDGDIGNLEVAPDIKVSYRTHIQTFGWEGTSDDITTWKSNGTMSGTSGLAKRLEGINIVVEPTTASEDLDLGIQYTTHCQSYGWLPWSADGDMNGTEGEAKRLEAIMIKLTGEHAQAYDVYYRVHAQSYGWLGWAKNGEPAGTAGYGKRLEGIQIVVVKKGEGYNKNMEGIISRYDSAFEAKAGSSPIVNYPATSNTIPLVPGEDDVNVAYRTHVQSFGWQGWKYNGQMSGTSGLAKRLEGIEIKLTNKDYDGGIAYATHVQTYGWQGADLDDPTTWKQDGEMAGTSGEAKRLEAICITLTGEMAEHYDIYYRVHAQSYGWLGWAKNGDPAGTAGYAKRLEGIQIVVVPKDSDAPASSYKGIISATTNPYVEK